ncbi:hypothetical protein BGW41_008248 [Actinomortierella wolfii]|nr:hypothetical protein BGW41_008248 [Actinomortierella wolfii]
MLRPPSAASQAMPLGDMSNEQGMPMQDDDAMIDATTVEKPPIVLLSQQLPSQSQQHQNDILQQLYQSYQIQANQHRDHSLLHHHGSAQELTLQQQQQLQDQQYRQHPQSSDIAALYRRKRSLSAPLLLKPEASTPSQQQARQPHEQDEDVDMGGDSEQSTDQDSRQITRRPPASDAITVSTLDRDTTTTQDVMSTRIESRTSLIPQPIIDYSKIYANRETFWASLPRYHRHKIYASIAQSRQDYADSSKNPTSKIAYSSIQRMPVARSVRCFYKLTPSQQWSAIPNPSSSSPSASLRPNASDLLSRSPWEAAMGVGRIVVRSSSSPSGVTKATQRSRLPVHIRHYTSRTQRRPAICIRPSTAPQDNAVIKKQESPSSIMSSISSPQRFDHNDPNEQDYGKEYPTNPHPHQIIFDHGSSHVLHLNPAGSKSVIETKDKGAMDRSAAYSLRHRLWANQRGGLLNIVTSTEGDGGGGGSDGVTTTKSNVDRLVEELNRWQV